MKKILSYSYMCAALLSLAACQSEEEDIFDKSAAERLNEASALYSGRLTDSADGWAFEYFANNTSSVDNYQCGVGYLMMVQFSKDYSARVGMSNPFTDSKYDEDTSAWEVITDMGAVLSFNTYNRMLHTFSVPEDVKGTETDETGKGMLGDYEFVIVDIPEGGNEVLLKGKKSKAYSRLTRVSAGTDFSEYIANVQKVQRDLLSNTAPNHLVMTLGEKQYYFVMPNKGGELGLTKLWPAGTDSTFTMTLNPLLMTRRVENADTTYVVRFRDAIEGSEDSEQEFVYDPKTFTFQGTKGAGNIAGEDPSFFFWEKWANNARFTLSRSSDGSDKAKQLINDVFNGYSDIKYTFQNVQLQADGDNAAILSFSYRTNKNASGKANYKFSCSREGDNLKLSYVEPVNSASETQYNSIAAIRDFCAATTGTYKIEAGNNPLNFNIISLQSTTDASLRFMPNYLK